MFYEAYHECMAPCMAFQVVHLSLLDVADVSHSQVRFPDRNVEREELAQGRLVVQGGETDVLPEILGDGHFIIGLSVFGREHQANEGYIQLVSEYESMFLDTELIDSYSRCANVGIRFGIHGIVRVP